jgi:undecaprenyl-diphosphatase
MARSLHDQLVYWDHVAWFYVNTQWHNSFFDVIMPFLRNQWFWAPLYLFLLLLMTSRFGKKGWFWCIAFLITFILSDQISAGFIKPHVNRIRPCNNPALADMVHIIVPCGSGKSFPSSHAANHFSMGIFSAMTLGRYARWVWPVAILWAAAVAYSQVYVGVHYPLDVICGGFLGAAIGIVTGALFNRYIRLTP